MDNDTPPSLTPSTLPGLYGNGLFLIGESAPAASMKAAPTANKRRHLILTSEEAKGPLMELLTGIIQACRINMTDVNIVHLGTQANYLDILENYGPAFVIMFGIEPVQLDLPIMFPPFQMQKFSNAVWVASPELGLIRNDKAMKTKLWNCLKSVYGI